MITGRPIQHLFELAQPYHRIFFNPLFDVAEGSTLQLLQTAMYHLNEGAGIYRKEREPIEGGTYTMPVIKVQVRLETPGSELICGIRPIEEDLTDLAIGHFTQHRESPSTWYIGYSTWDTQSVLFQLFKEREFMGEYHIYFRKSNR